MPIGKDSITKRVARTQNEENIAPELVATVAAAPAPKKPTAPKAKSAPAKKTSPTEKTTTQAKRSTSTTTKKPVDATAPKAEKAVETTVLSNVSPETVKAVIGHAENEKYEKVRIGQKMPDFLL